PKHAFGVRQAEAREVRRDIAQGGSRFIGPFGARRSNRFCLSLLAGLSLRRFPFTWSIGFGLSHVLGHLAYHLACRAIEAQAFEGRMAHDAVARPFGELNFGDKLGLNPGGAAFARGVDERRRLARELLQSLVEI